MSSLPSVVLELAPELAAKTPPLLSSRDVERLLVESVHLKRVAELARALLALDSSVLAEESRQRAAAALSACGKISDHSLMQRTELISALQSAGVLAKPIRSQADAGEQQVHRFQVAMERREIGRAAEIAVANGFQSWAPWKGGALECFLRSGNGLTMVKTDAVTTRLDLKWEAAEVPPRRRRNVFRPSASDLALVALPRALWWGYYLLKPVRMAREMIVGRSVPPAAWPFLGTPASLIPALLDVAEVGPSDLLVDIGCGDGRVLIEAATRCGCRALGIEKDPALAERARRLAADSPAGERITILQGDASETSLSEATVVFLFLPVSSIPGIVESLRKQLPAGARIVAHEQERMVSSCAPERSLPLFAVDAVTVAHTWRV